MAALVRPGGCRRLSRHGGGEGLAPRPRQLRARTRARREQRLPRRARGADPGRYRPPSRPPGQAAGLCARTRPANRCDRQHPLAPRSQRGQFRDSRRLAERARLCERGRRRRPDRLLPEGPPRGGGISRLGTGERGAGGGDQARFRGDGRRDLASRDSARNPLGLGKDRRAPAAGEPRPLCGDRGRRLDLRFPLEAADRGRPGRRTGAVFRHRLPRRLAQGLGRARRDSLRHSCPRPWRADDQAPIPAVADGVRQSARLRRFGTGEIGLRSRLEARRGALHPGGDRRVDSMVGYYLDTRLRAAPEERDRFCRPLR